MSKEKIIFLVGIVVAIVVANVLTKVAEKKVPFLK